MVMNTRGAISVVIIVQNHADRLLDLVASVLSQLDTGDEILMVVGPAPVDSPSDMTREVADEIARQVPCARVLINETKHETAAYEQAIRACKGTYIFLAEPGDIWAPNKVSDMLDAFTMSGSVLILHDAELFDVARRVLTPSLFSLQGSQSGFTENLLHNSYLGSCFAFLEPFREFFLPFPSEAIHPDQWIGLIAERFGGVALVTKPLIGKMAVSGDGSMSASLNPHVRRDEQRRLLKALRKREKELSSLLRHSEKH
jgi:hypothetical protein